MTMDAPRPSSNDRILHIVIWALVGVLAATLLTIGALKLSGRARERDAAAFDAAWSEYLKSAMERSLQGGATPYQEGTLPGMNRLRALGRGKSLSDYMEGNLLYQESRFDEARARFEACLARDPRSTLAPSAHCSIAYCLEAVGRMNEAAKAYQTASEVAVDGLSVKQAALEGLERCRRLSGLTPEALMP